MTNPTFSIVIANYNYGRFLEAAIRSVAAQDMGNKVELIICDAASTDNSVDIIKKYADGLPPNTSRLKWVDSDAKPQASSSRLITWWCSEKDGGQSAAFNKGFSHANGRFLTWLNADDIFTNGALRAIAHEINMHPDCEWFAGSSVWTDSELNIQRCFCAHRFSSLRARYGSISVGGPSSFFTKRLLVKVGGFDEGLHYMMDTDLWYKFYRKCGVKYLRTRHNVFAYRQHEASKMSGADEHATERALENRRRALLESKVLDQRYGRSQGIGSRLALILSASPCDAFVSFRRELKWHGLSATSI